VVGEGDSECYFNSREEEINKRVLYLIFKARQGLPSVPSSKVQSDFALLYFKAISSNFQSDFEPEITFEIASGKRRFRLL
jgi:hypothetical protein